MEPHRPASQRLRHHPPCPPPELLAKYLGVAPADLDALAIADPHKAVAVDVAALKANPLLPGGFLVTGLVYDVTTGRIEIVVPPFFVASRKPCLKPGFVYRLISS